MIDLPDLSFDEIAIKMGFKSAADYFTRYIKHFGAAELLSDYKAWLAGDFNTRMYIEELLTDD